ncbi:MAG: RNA 2',3'-cyclic phosphodiesterase [Bifidobacteriaceae bacterium]|jgi:2'-5' RNA ligase|nr:RNA 2',3'-cyclic phosphodiesterase [Bifidobacteriaceae bacterium]
MRLFAAIRPPQPVADHLSVALASALTPSTDRSSPLIPRANWHITLAFYGEVPTGGLDSLSGALAAELIQMAPFELELRGAGCTRGRVGWVGVGGDLAAFRRLAATARAAWPGTAGEQRPHLTITRRADRTPTSDALRALSVYVGPSWPVHQVELIRSDLGQGPARHPLYTTLATLALA